MIATAGEHKEKTGIFPGAGIFLDFVRANVDQRPGKKGVVQHSVSCTVVPQAVGATTGAEGPHGGTYAGRRTMAN